MSISCGGVATGTGAIGIAGTAGIITAGGGTTIGIGGGTIITGGGTTITIGGGTIIATGGETHPGPRIGKPARQCRAGWVAARRAG